MNKISLNLKTVAKVACGLMVATVFVACNNDDKVIEPVVPASDATVEQLNVQSIQADGRVVNLETKANTPSDISRVVNVASRTVKNAAGQDVALSATGVEVDAAGNVLISYHVNPENNGGDKEHVRGAFEAWKFDEAVAGKFVPGSWAEAKGKAADGVTEDFYKFNNVMLDGSNLYFVGSSEKKAGIIAKASLSDGRIGSELKINTVHGRQLHEGLQQDHVAGDVNAVIKYGENLMTGSTAGFQLFTSELVKGAYKLVPENEKVKAVDYDGNTVVFLTVREESDLCAITIYKWDGSSFPTGDITSIYNTVQLVGTSDEFNLNAKHSIKLVDGVVYATLGEVGVIAVNVEGSASVWPDDYDQKATMIRAGIFSLRQQGTTSFRPKDNSFANGLDVVDGVVYVAYGANGIYMLNAADGKVIAKYDSSNLPWDAEVDGYVMEEDGVTFKLDEKGKWIPNTKTVDSANAIKVVGDYIFVAQSQEGVVVYKYTEPEIEG